MRIRQYRRLWEVRLCDDGTLDTVIEVGDVRGDYPTREFRFDGEYASYYRRADGSLTLRGLRELGREAVSEYVEDEAEFAEGIAAF